MKKTLFKLSNKNIRHFKGNWFENKFPSWSPSYRQVGLNKLKIYQNNINSFSFSLFPHFFRLIVSRYVD